jgi:uncharacterized damage-inducible protein DinB
MAIPTHKYRGAAAMIALHEAELRHLVEIWKDAKALNVHLPDTDDPSYASMDALIQHLMRAARGYMVWMCEQLGLPDPGIPATPPPETIAGQLDSYLEIVLDKWKTPLKDVPEELFDDKTYLSRWKVPHTIEQMLEHAVTHPMRHRYQLQNLMREV